VTTPRGEIQKVTP
jgi:hypothetical protein